MRKRSFISFLLTFFFAVSSYSQTIQMYFPHFAGKTYDFILFAGEKQFTVKDTVPPGGRFTLEIPYFFRPYTGMCRWLLTNNKEGGGLDMIVPGHDFSVSCTEASPSENNIIYENNAEPSELLRLSMQQDSISSRCGIMLRAKQLYPKTDALYSVFEKEYTRQLKAFDAFQDALQQNPMYAAKFLQIVNLTRGIGNSIAESEYSRSQVIARFVADDLDWDKLYVSGHWKEVIALWLNSNTQVLKNPFGFSDDFSKIAKRISAKDEFQDFVTETTRLLTQQGQDAMISMIAPTVLSSGKMTNYDGVLQVFKVGAEGTKAADLVLRVGKDSAGIKIPPVVLKSRNFAGEGYNRTLLFFYEAGCPGCDMLINDLLPKYDSLKTSGVRVIAVSADWDDASFRGRSSVFPWKDTYCDFKGMDGVNFKNYGVAATPTVFWINKDGVIEKRQAGIVPNSSAGY